MIIVAAVASSALNFLLQPRVKGDKPDAVTDLEDPTAEAGRPIPVVFGSVMIKGGNVLWSGQKSTVQKKVKA
jgi:hypothetical protein